MQLRPYQSDLKQAIYRSWQTGNRNVAAVLPTGSGKTVLFSSVIHDFNGASCAIAHRKELVSQIALSLAREEIPHRVIGPTSLVKFIVQEQLRELGTTYFNPNAKCAVAGVNTLVNRSTELRDWLPQVGLWVQDECHHLLDRNIWGKAVKMFPNALGLGVTATLVRADGHGLGRHAQGVMDDFVEGPGMRWLIDNGYLCDYKIFCPPSDLKLDSVPVSDATGDYVQPKLKKAVRESHIVGDVIAHYQRLAYGKLNVVFASDVETAGDISARFNAAGIKAEVISAETEPHLRSEIVRRFRNREISVLVNVDLFGEGFDLPAIECVQFARPTQSYGLYCQQFGRSLRPMKGKTHALIIDHVGNVFRHGLPDTPRHWSLDAREKRSSNGSSDELALRPCPQCTRPYLRAATECPYCQYKPEPSCRNGPDFVDGDLLELDAATLARMRGEVDRVDANPHDVAQAMERAGAPRAAIMGMMKQHGLRQDAQTALRNSIAWWAGWQSQQGRSDSESYKRFYLTFGTDILTAQSLGRPEAMELAHRINTYIGETLR